jgi:LysM repeat protein
MIKKICGTFLLMCAILFTKAQTNETTLQYIKTYCGIAVTEMQRTGVPAAIKLAQGVLETMSGQSPLVIKSNNHFGIKCKQGYDGPYVLHDDDRPQERFMKYEDAGQSYKDHSDFLKGRSRYAGLFELDPTDYAGWANGLKKAGYATNPKYPQLLIGIIEKYNLAEYTLMGLGKAEWNEDVKTYVAKHSGEAVPTHAVAVTVAPAQPVKSAYPEGEFLINNTKVVILNAGASLTEVANKYNIPVDRLHAMNDFGTTAEKVQKATLVFLQLKRTVCEKAYHEVMAGENIYDIAQAEGIRLESLLKLNNLGKYDIPAAGTRLKLRDDSASVAKN